MSFFGARNRSEFGRTSNEFSLGHGEFERPLEILDCYAGLAPQEMGLEVWREVGGPPGSVRDKLSRGPWLGLL